MSETERIDTLKALQKQIREATGPDREIDGEIAKVFLGWTFEKMKGDARPYWRSPEQKHYYQRKSDGPRLLTTYPDGLGACVALMLEVLPGCQWSVGVMGEGPFSRILDCHGLPIAFSDGAYANPCLALIGGTIAARIAEIETKERVG